jgi:adenylate cyclase
VNRRLAAIMVCDVVGSSRLIEADEAGALAAMRDRWAMILEPEVEAAGGRVVKYLGDGAIAEFSSAVAAVSCALAIQGRMGDANADLPPDRCIVLRIGINVGDVVEEGGDVFGDGVNVAARIEAHAPPGGVCITGAVQEAIRGKLPAAVEDMGERALKNFGRPVRLWRIVSPAGASRAPGPDPGGKAAYQRDRPSIAVLPFTNMSGDAEQEYFSDGITEDIITELSRFRDLLVIARNSSFIYKGRAVDVTQVGRELGVGYVLEGSVRKAGDRMRITGQLVDSATGMHLWAERFDGGLSDVFALQDRVTASVIRAIAPRLERAEIERVRRKPTESLAAYDHYLRGIERVHHWTLPANEAALESFYRAIELDPGFAAAWGMAARCYSQRKACGWSQDAEADRAETGRLVARAITIGGDDAMALSSAGIAMGFVVEDLETAQEMTDRALVLNPNLVWALYTGGWVKLWAGYPAEAAERLGKAIELSPNDPHLLFMMQDALATALFLLDRYEEAYVLATAALRFKPDFALSRVVAAAAADLTGRQDEAGHHLRQAMSLLPDFRLSRIGEFFPEVRRANKPKFIDVLRRIGLPE